MVIRSLILLVFLTIVNLPFNHGQTESSEPQDVRAAYWPTFIDYPASNIDTSHFSHIYFAFVLPSPTTYVLDITPDDVTNLLEFTNAKSGWNPPAKTILSVGGGGGDDLRATFSRMASNQYSRASFINSTIEVARKYQFDGIDLDWEYPSSDSDMANLGVLLNEWREAIEQEANVNQKPRLILTSAVYYASRVYSDNGPLLYPIKAITQSVDWISPMCYDYHGSWENFTGLHSALYDPDSDLNTDFGIGSWIQAGVAPEKIVMGLPLYGKTWSLEDPKVNNVGAKTIGTGPGSGELRYSEVIDFNKKNSAMVVFDDKRVSYYSYSGNSWISYDDVRSIQSKVRYAKNRALSGYFLWALGQDLDWALSSAASETWLN
ncbi:hypothetical protein Lser_V15G31312 [Lactuca serriola]